VTSRYFDEPVIVHYRDHVGWQRALAVGVRRSDDHTYDVLIMRTHHQGDESVSWVPRSRIRVEDAAMV
jgi:hypothetical protein